MTVSGQLAIVLLSFVCSLLPTWCQDVHSNKIYDVLNRKSNSFQLYWNVPTFQCRSKGVNFGELAEKYDFLQNSNDDFRGEKITILYDPGVFPAILKSESTNKIVLRNGGVPQEGDLNVHLKVYEEIVDQLIPNKNFSGLAVIDFESWRPIFRQNFGSLVPYKDLSYKIEKQKHPLWPEKDIKKHATQRFEAKGREFVEETIKFSKKLRPVAKWGYYAYPYCFNMSPNNMNTHCSTEVKKENDILNWMFTASDMLNPSLYMPEERLDAEERIQMIEGRIVEAKRINKNNGLNLPIFPYYWFKYQDTNNYVSKSDLLASFSKLKKLGTSGIIMWGSSNDVNNKNKCLDLYEYVDTILGPLWQNFSN